MVCAREVVKKHRAPFLCMSGCAWKHKQACMPSTFDPVGLSFSRMGSGAGHTSPLLGRRADRVAWDFRVRTEPWPRKYTEKGELRPARHHVISAGGEGQSFGQSWYAGPYFPPLSKATAPHLRRGESTERRNCSREYSTDTLFPVIAVLSDYPPGFLLRSGLHSCSSTGRRYGDAVRCHRRAVAAMEARGQRDLGRIRTCSFGASAAGDNSPVPRPTWGASANFATRSLCLRAARVVGEGRENQTRREARLLRAV